MAEPRGHRRGRAGRGRNDRLRPGRAVGAGAVASRRRLFRPQVRECGRPGGPVQLRVLRTAVRPEPDAAARPRARRPGQRAAVPAPDRAHLDRNVARGPYRRADRTSRCPRPRPGRPGRHAPRGGVGQHLLVALAAGAYPASRRVLLGVACAHHDLAVDRGRRARPARGRVRGVQHRPPGRRGRRHRHLRSAARGQSHPQGRIRHLRARRLRRHRGRPAADPGRPRPRPPRWSRTRRSPEVLVTGAVR